MRKFIFILILPFILVSCKVQQNQVNDKTEIIILHTNDIHGNIDVFPRFAFMVDSIRSIHKNVFLLNAGDIFTGNPYVDMHEDKGFPVIDLMNDVGFDLSAIGNHEFDYGQEILEKRMNQAKFPFICANMENDGGYLKKPKEYVTLNSVNGLKINVFSVVDNSANGLPESHPVKLKGLKFTNGIAYSKKFKNLKNEGNALIALTHLGVEADTVLALEMPEIDLIAGAHSHTLIKDEKILNGVLISQSGGRLKYFSEIVLTFEKGKLVSKKRKVLSVSKEGNINPDLKKKVDSFNKNPYFDEVIGFANNELKGIEEIGSFITDAYRTYAKSDFAFQNSGGIRISEIEKGNIPRALIFKLDPFGNNLVVLEMSLKEIKSLLMNSYKRNEIDLRVSGMNYNYITENGELKDVQMTDYQWNPLQDKVYKVALNDYITNTYNFEHAQNPESLGIITAETLINYLKNSSLDYSGVQRAFIDKK